MLVGLLISICIICCTRRGDQKIPHARDVRRKETLEHILCECLVLEKIKMQTLGFARVDPDQIKEARRSSIVALGKRTGLLNSSL